MVTFRLADSLPDNVVAKLAADHRRMEADPVYRKKVEQYLDTGHGACWLRQSEIAGCVKECLHQFDGTRYCLHAYVLMPNHVHILCEVIPPFLLQKIIQTWKSYTARRINRLLSHDGPVWQPEYWDRYIRDELHYFDAWEYLLQNPVKAGLVDRPEDWNWTWARALPR
ncbi:MAG TPA: transposase [Planctomycetota bacterium]|nr:transposase [Planctomycetota bacterium]